jgi:alkanesulfonate monooxygenase SsuD/methylene tetrahydromethanopterin reductase-like flavin-dependent oxidoreductase (luciferase family)
MNPAEGASYGAAFLVERHDWGDLDTLARDAEGAGWRYLFCAEGPYGGDSNGVVASTILAEHTTRAYVGTCIAIIYLRSPWLAAASAGTLQERTGGRYVLGLGTSHPSIIEPLGITMGRPLDDLRAYVGKVRRILAEMPFPDVEIWIAAVNDRMARLGGEIADGVIFHHVPLSHFPRSMAAVREGEEQAAKERRTMIAAYARIAMTDDLQRAREMGRDVTYDFLHFPAYQKIYRQSGYVEEMRAVVAAIETSDRDAAYGAITDEFMDDYLVLGSPDRCRQQLGRFAEAGVDVSLFAPLPMTGIPLAERYKPLFTEFRAG